METRVSDEGDSIRRRRRCLACEKRFTTFERVELIMPTVVKRDGSRCEYDPSKLRSSLMLALRKRPVGVDAIDAVLRRIEEQLRNRGEREVPTAVIGEWVMQALRELDQIAYVRFASVYRNFEDIDEFAHALREVSTAGPEVSP